MSLIDNLISQEWLKTERIIKAFREIKREDFLPKDLKDLAQQNTALPIGYEQTISQPLTVAFMLELLQPKLGDKILDIGSGSGWTTALLAYIVSQKGNPKSQILNSKQIQNSKFQIPKGKVIAIEIIPELVEFAKKNVSRYNFIEKGIVEFVCQDGKKGYLAQAPFDKILCSAAVQQQNIEGAMGESISPIAEILKPRGFRERSEAKRCEAEAREIPNAWKEQLKINGRIVTPIGNSIYLFKKISEQELEKKEYPGFVFVPLIDSKQKNN